MPKALISSPSFFGFSVFVFFLRPGLALVLTGPVGGKGAGGVTPTVPFLIFDEWPELASNVGAVLRLWLID
jgi:hypothetical protein